MISLHIDCSAGLSGDMFLAAFSHLGVDFAPLASLFHSVGIDLCVTAHEENRAAGTGRTITIEATGQQPVRHLSDLTRITAGLGCSDFVKKESLLAFRELARAEAAVHGCSEDEVHFHEVGAVDTLFDVIGAFYAIEKTGIHNMTATPLPWFSGTTVCEHGEIPLPAPATLVLMEGLPVTPTSRKDEAVTPTGALILRQLASCLPPAPTSDEFSPCSGTHFSGPSGTIIACGTGYGSRQHPHGLRLLLTRQGGTSQNEYLHDQVIMLESHIDHLTGEELGLAIQAVQADGALDVLWLPGITKKNRPGGALRVLCRPVDEEQILASFFRHTHTLGIRHCRLSRSILARQKKTGSESKTALCQKSYVLEGKKYSRPESDSIKQVAEQQGIGAPGVRLEDRQNKM